MIRLGMLTPSSNTVLEPVSAALLAGVQGVSLHFARFRVTEIALDRAALGQFDPEPMLAAAELLSHAKVDCITWNGTSASWTGLDGDRALVLAIEARTAIKATTCVLTLMNTLRRHGMTRIGLVTPYTADVQARIGSTLAGEGVTVVAERHLGIRDNFSFGLVDRAALDGMVDAVAAERPDAIVVLCTNLAGAAHVAGWEARLRVPVLDSVALSLVGALDACGMDRAGLRGRGWLFDQPCG
ncbi:Asp/Glu/hydantoin racemase [Alsobacter metallidurans]|uniref:Asp/Glu/hydantoin racemase n=1 Tax=Alsobacter metallidurans TaxID=340221 RepID=A0A917MIG1_9HYPH|nr:aspartate/glutamate racemase family protein [Alsobacter metallidurans]GGH22973.1 Asp/Glu/hydantoin racemase [Alsobacter metallidurans]